MNNYTILLPVINETNSLNKTIEIINNQNKSNKINFLFICSKKLTTNEALNICKKYIKIDFKKYKLIFQNKNRLGGALIDSIHHIKTSHAIMMASDLETNPATVYQLIKKSKKNVDKIICTSRWITPNSFEDYGILKKIMNKIFQNFFGVLFNTKLTDLTFGFRLYPTIILKKYKWEIHNFGFLFESIIKPIHFKDSAIELPTNWQKRKEGESNNSISYYLTYFYVGLRIKLSKSY